MKKTLTMILLLTLSLTAPAQTERPTMGWSSWNTYRVNISDSLIMRQADAMLSKGLKQAGYRYVNIDDGYFGGRDMGLYGHDRQDCDMFFRELGFDFIKVDYCGGLSVSVEGAATLLALDNGDHYTDDLFAGIAKKKMRGGKMQVILRSKREAGQVTVSAVSGNFKATYKTMTK